MALEFEPGKNIAMKIRRMSMKKPSVSTETFCDSKS